MTAPRRRLVYVYGFAPARPQVPADLRIERGGIVALATLVPRSFVERVRDPAWVVERARRHHATLQALSARAPAVVPCRFGTLFRDRASVVRALVRHGRALRRLLRRLRGRQEWSVKVSLAKDDGVGEGSGAAYLLARVRRRETARRAPLHARRIRAAITRAGVETVEVAPWRDGTSLVNLACLVPRDRAASWKSRLRRLAERGRRRGIALAWTGPWPAYSFVGDPLGEGRVQPGGSSQPIAGGRKDRAILTAAGRGTLRGGNRRPARRRSLAPPAA